MDQLTSLEKDLQGQEEQTNHCARFSCHNWIKCPKLETGEDVSSCILSIPQSAQSAQSDQLTVYSQSVFQEFEENEFFMADWPLVGRGVKHASCGTFWTHICLEKHDPKKLPAGIAHQKDLNGLCERDGVFIKRVKMSCHRPICPECWTNWRKRQVARVKNRFEAFEKDFNRREKRHVKRCHGAISVPKSLWDLTQPQMKKRALNCLKKIGIDGGTIIYHPKRQRKNNKNVWYYSPHFHVYFEAFNARVDGSKVKKLYDKTGWVFRNFGERVLTKSISYQLSHAGVPPNHGHVVTWFGVMNYRMLHVEKFESKPACCPWGHKLNRYGVYVGKNRLVLPEEDGYEAYLPREGWVMLPKRFGG